MLLALGGKVSSDLQEVIRRRPKLFAELLRQLHEKPDHAILRVVHELPDDGLDGGCFTRFDAGRGGDSV